MPRAQVIIFPEFGTKLWCSILAQGFGYPGCFCFLSGCRLGRLPRAAAARGLFAPLALSRRGAVCDAVGLRPDGLRPSKSFTLRSTGGAHGDSCRLRLGGARRPRTLTVPQRDG